MSGDREAAASEAAMADFWVRGFGPQGLPSFILDSVMPYLTERANHYLETLADGDILMEFTTQRELKSDKGALRDEIAINWTIEGIAGYPPSGGQQRKMEVATDLALMDLAEAREGSGLSLFMADEILDGLDAEGTERVMSLLQDLRARRSTVFVISHASSMHELFERQFTVVKEDGVSRLEIAR
jgi:DNA repair exonuclease SbcCD ATPase subunit